MIGFRSLFLFALNVPLSFGGPLFEAADQLYATLTGRTAGHTLPLQFLTAANTLARGGTSRLLTNLENRRRANAAVFQNNLGGVVKATEHVKEAVGNTYAGAGILGMATAAKELLRAPRVVDMLKESSRDG